MFTVKVVEDRNNSETLFEARSVRCSVDITNPDMPRQVVCHPLDGDPIIYDVRKACEPNDSQRMFVMNRFGATVATYRL